MKLVPIFAALMLSAASLTAMGAAMTRTDLVGESVSPTAASRTIVINDNTKWVNVTHGDVVKFVANGQEFAFAFDGQPFESIDLAQIAPSGALAHTVQVYIAPTESDYNGD
jgi:Heavy-metal resistance protein CzcE